MPLKPKPIAMFNRHFILAAIFPSISEAASTVGTPRQSIMKNIAGELIMAKKKYWREIPDNIVLDQDDVGSLSMIEFDRKVNNPDRIVYLFKRGKKIKTKESTLQPYPTQSFF